MNTKSFATRSQWVTNHNFPTVPGVHILGLDMGYSAPKIVYENGQIVFPNFCKKLEGELIGELPKGAIVYENPAGDRYYVGKMALNTLSEDSVVAEDSLFGRNHYLHSDFRVVFDTALGLALWNIDTDGTDLFLQTGLPPAYMTKDESYIRAAMTGTHEFSLIVEGQKKNFSVSITNEQRVFDSIFLQKGNSAFGCRDFEAICMPPPYLRAKSDYLPGKQTLYL